MAIVTYPLNGIMYNAENAETYLCTRTSGVYSADDNFSVQADGTMQVTVNPGLAWIKNGDFAGKSVVSTEPVILSFAMADGVLNRKDRIVLRFDVGENATNIVVKQGTPASTAEPKPIERTGTVYELGLYVVDIPAGTLGLSAANITSTMLDESVCGIMRDGVTGIPTAQLQEQAEALMKQVAESVNQWEQEQTAEFEEWFEGIKGVLDGDTAGNLLNMIQQETTERKAADSAIESKLGINATAVYEESTVNITAPEGLVVVTFLAPSDCKSGDKYTLNGDALTMTDLNGEGVEDGWKQGAPVTFTISGNKAFFKAGGAGVNETLPAQVTNFKAVQASGAKSVTVSWTKPSSYFSGILIVRKTGSAPTGVKDGTQAYKGTGSSFVDSSANYGTTYYYRAFPYNSKGQYQTEYNVTNVTLTQNVSLSSKSEGTLIRINENGSPRLFYLAQHNYQSDLNGNGRTLMVRKDIYSLGAFDSGSSNKYSGSDIDTTLANTYKSKLSSKAQSMIGSTKFHCNNETLTRSVFALSMTEFSYADITAPIEGDPVPIYETLRVAYYEGQSRDQWTRTENTVTSNYVYTILTTGSFDTHTASTYLGIRPAFTLPADATLNPVANSDGSYTLIES